MADNQQNNNKEETLDYNDISLTEILQAHDILISILLGNSLANSKDPVKLIGRIKNIVSVQEISDNVKQHLLAMLEPLLENLEEK